MFLRVVGGSAPSILNFKFQSIHLHFFYNLRRILQKLLVHLILLPLWCSGPTLKGKQSLRHIQKETRCRKIKRKLSTWIERLLLFQRTFRSYLRLFCFCALWQKKKLTDIQLLFLTLFSQILSSNYEIITSDHVLPRWYVHLITVYLKWAVLSQVIIP